MSPNIIVAAKQVIDPETPPSALRINQERRRMETPSSIAPVVNGFDENAVEAALRIKDAQGAKITVVSAGKDFVLDVIKKPLSMGCDELVLIRDDALDGLDA
ncbi:MAG: electron transfer flavoprotein subunit beta/FixA family protein, partial [Chloroflexi bacterium]|nr:electron transfer flavoprotein subunit beta/FixA family protein [Chloroflexota bacterium]